jgi:hypothetical protein
MIINEIENELNYEYIKMAENRIKQSTNQQDLFR